MPTRQYIGARYVPKFYENTDETNNWKENIEYEPLTIVTYAYNMYISKIPVPSTVGNPSDNPKYWVNVGNYNEQVELYRREVAELSENVEDYAETVEEYKNSIYNFLDSKARMEAEYQTSYALNGATYIGNNKVVYYCCSQSNTGTLTCFNIASKTLLWEYDLPLMHGGSICYNQRTNKIYVTATFDQGDIGNVLDTVFVINPDNPSVIENTIHLTYSATSIAYDYDTDRYYTLFGLGSNEGVANRVDIYDASFNFVNSVTLKQFPSVLFGVSTQGIACILDGKIVIPVYDKAPAIMMWDFEGNYVCSYTLPKIVSGYKKIWEVQNCFIYDNKLYFGFVSWVSLHNQGVNFAVTNIIDDIYEEELITMYSDEVSVTVRNQTKNDFKSAIDLGYLCDICDSFTMSQYYPSIRFTFLLSGESISRHLDINNVKAIFSGDLIFHSLTFKDCDVYLARIRITDSVTSSSYALNLVAVNSKVLLDNCTFDNSNSIYATGGWDQSEIYANACTYTDESMIGICSSGSTFFDADHRLVCTPTSGMLPGRLVELYNGTVTQGETYNYKSNILRGNIGSGFILCVAAGGATMGTFNISGNITGAVTWFEGGNMYTRAVKTTLGANTFTVNEVHQWNHSTHADSAGGNASIRLYALL